MELDVIGLILGDFETFERELCHTPEPEPQEPLVVD
jgi:hypothetical protein